MGLDVHAGLILGIPVTAADFFEEKGQERSCVNLHKFPVESDFEFCPKCGKQLIVLTTLVPKPHIAKMKQWKNLRPDHKDPLYNEDPKDGVVQVFKVNAMQCYEDQDPPHALGIRLAYTDSHRSHGVKEVGVQGVLLDGLPALVEKIKEEARLLEIPPGRTFRLYTFAYLSY